MVVVVLRIHVEGIMAVVVSLVVEVGEAEVALVVVVSEALAVVALEVEVLVVVGKIRFYFFATIL
jgi:hypothetical protein